MKRLLVVVLCWMIYAPWAHAELHYEITTVPSPAGPGSSSASFTTGPDGKVWLAWIERAGSQEHALKFSSFDGAALRWTASRTIAQGRNWTASGAETPVLAVQAEGRVTAVWAVNNPLPTHDSATHESAVHHGHHAAGRHAVISQSQDDGTSWSAPQPLTRESDVVEFVSLQALADGRLLAAWLDGRAKKSQRPQQLFSRVIGSTTPDTLVDARVCDCCPTALTAFPDGSALLAYRGRDAEEIRDIISVRQVDDQWEKARNATRDGWKIAGCPVNGPRITSAGPRVGKVWFTAANERPSVLVAMSHDAGGVYTQSMRADLGQPLGRPDILLLRDGSQLVTWLEQNSSKGSGDAGLYLRRYSSGGATHPPVRLAAIDEVRSAGHPRIALVKDSDATPAQFVAAFTRAGDVSRVETVVVTLPAAELIAAADSSCACAPRGEELAGYPMRGQVLETREDGSALRVRHRAVPGLLRAGEREFKVAAKVGTMVQPGTEVLARIEQREGTWVMFDLRLLGKSLP